MTSLSNIAAWEKLELPYRIRAPKLPEVKLEMCVWCNENIAVDEWNYRFIGDTTYFMFKAEDDLIKFKLIWSEEL